MKRIGGLLLLAVCLWPPPASSACVTPTKRHAAVRRRFQIQTGYPHGRPGWVVDHIVPLCACGPDTVANMQWQTATAAAIKDAHEREQCRALRRTP